MFQNQFANCLKNALVVVPIISSDALLRLCSGDGTKEDNVIVEVSRVTVSTDFSFLCYLGANCIILFVCY